MMNSDLTISITPFDTMADNAAKSLPMKWGVFANSLTCSHAITVRDKQLLPLFNGWRYKDVSDATVDNGMHSNGDPIKRFSNTHVRRHAPNLIDLSMLVLDFDGALPIVDVNHRFGEYEYVCYTSLNHRVTGVDKFRVVLPFSAPIPKSDFVRLVGGIRDWVIGKQPNVVDDSAFTVGQMFILPAVRYEHRLYAQSWRNVGKLLDWTSFDSLPNVSALGSVEKLQARIGEPNELILEADDLLKTRNGSIVVGEIREKVSYVQCPFHSDAIPSEFVAVTKNGTPFLHCKRCGTVYMNRGGNDGIVAGLARIAEEKRRRTIQGGVL